MAPTTPVEVIRIRNGDALTAFPAVRAILRRGLSIHTLCPDIEAALAELAETVHEDGVGLFMARDQGYWNAWALCQWGRSRFNPVCTVAHFYSEGTKAAREGTIQACIDYALEGGYTRLLGVDVNHKPRGFARLFRAAGPTHYVGEIYEFDLSRRGD
jgi:hypothetical protein